MDIAKLEFKNFRLNLDQFNLQKLLSSVIDMLGETARLNGVEFAAYIESDVPAVIKSDARRLKQVIVNLLDNALKFTRHGHIHLKVSCSPLT